MTTTADLLDMAKDRLGLTSDYQLAKALKWPFTTVSGYRRHKRAMEVAQVADFHGKTGIPLELVVKIAVEEGQRLKSEKRGGPVQPSLKFGAAA